MNFTDGHKQEESNEGRSISVIYLWRARCLPGLIEAERQWQGKINRNTWEQRHKIRPGVSLGRKSAQCSLAGTSVLRIPRVRERERESEAERCKHAVKGHPTAVKSSALYFLINIGVLRSEKNQACIEPLIDQVWVSQANQPTNLHYALPLNL